MHDKLHDKLHDKFPSADRVDEQILRLILRKPTTTANEMSEKLSVSLRTIRTHLAHLQQAQIIERQGSNKKGTWRCLVGRE